MDGDRGSATMSGCGGTVIGVRSMLSLGDRGSRWRGKKCLSAPAAATGVREENAD